MEDILNQKNLNQYIKSNNYKISHETLQHVVDSLKKKNSKLFKDLNNSSKVKVGGRISLPSEFFGSNSGNYNSILSSSPTEISTPNAISEYTRPPMSSNVFPLDGGCAGTCGIGGMSGGGKNKKKGGCDCIGYHKRKDCNQKGGCKVCLNLFRYSDIKNISKMLNVNIAKRDYNKASNYLNFQLKSILDNTFNHVKNKDKLIGKSHFNKALKQI